MYIKSVYILVICILLTNTIAHAAPLEVGKFPINYDQQIDKYCYSFIQAGQKNTLARQNSIYFQKSARVYASSLKSQRNLSHVGASLSFHRDIGFEVPFFGAFGYHRQLVSFAHIGRDYSINLGLLGSIEYTKTAWADSFFGLDPPLMPKLSF